MKLKYIDNYLIDRGFKLLKSYKGNIHYCSIYERDDKTERMHIWYDDVDNVFIDNIYREIDSSVTDITGLQQKCNLIEEIREFKLNKIIKKEDSSL